MGDCQYIIVGVVSFFFLRGSWNTLWLWLSGVRVLYLSKIVVHGDCQGVAVRLVNLKDWVITLGGLRKLDSVCVAGVNDSQCRTINLITARNAHLSLAFQLDVAGACYSLDWVLAAYALCMHPFSEQLLCLAWERNCLRNSSTSGNRRWKLASALHVNLVVLAKFVICLRGAHF